MKNVCVDFGELKLLELKKKTNKKKTSGQRQFVSPAAAEVCVMQAGEQPTWFSLVSINATAQTQPWSGLHQPADDS